MIKRYSKGSWRGPSNGQSGYTFRKKPAPEDLAWKLLDYIELCEYAGVPATKKEFLLDFLGMKLTKRQLPGQLTSLFGAAQDAGLVDLNRNGRTYYYTKGLNANCYRAGTLKCTKVKYRNAGFGGGTFAPAAPTTVSRTAVIKAGSFVVMVAYKDTPAMDLAEDVAYADNHDFGWRPFIFGAFIKLLKHDVTFDEGRMQYASNSGGYLDPSPFSQFPYGFLTDDKWGKKWELMCVKEDDLLWKS